MKAEKENGRKAVRVEGLLKGLEEFRPLDGLHQIESLCCGVHNELCPEAEEHEDRYLELFHTLENSLEKEGDKKLLKELDSANGDRLIDAEDASILTGIAIGLKIAGYAPGRIADILTALALR